MSFCVDIVSEDSFYENLVLGVTKLLDSHQRVSNVIVERRLPVDRLALSTWEQRHSLTLPDDIRYFYLSTDGFCLKWSYQYSQDEALPVGKINVNCLVDLTPTQALREILDQNASKISNPNEKIPIGPKSKIFELDDCRNNGKVCLIHNDNDWSIWLLDSEGTWTWLADTFTCYFRMALVHQGLPGWQAVFSVGGLLPWAEQLFLLMAPHLLADSSDKSVRTLSSASDAPLNHIDPTIFKAPAKHVNRGIVPKPQN